MNNETCISSPNKITSILDHPIPLMIGAAGIILLITCLRNFPWMKKVKIKGFESDC
ncbi:uncharacterized protein LOC143238974 isoform X5 [Tachypleus tridentatus]|uniref:uncharacterized protein LOC143238974 isoform X5 n=1 Tax=Tachypleus tridentatus TaxID=6853 RepID=UPI003FD435C1